MTSQSLLWNLRASQGQEIFLFGTMHIRDDRAYQLCHHLYPLIESSDAFIGEMDLQLPDGSPSMNAYDMRMHLKDTSYQKIRHQFQKSFKFNIDNCVHLHPLMIMSVISTSVLQAEHLISLDEHLWKFARDHGKPTSGLESYEEQMRILHSIDPVPLYRQLLKISQNPSIIRKQTATGLRLYIEGEIHQLYMLSKSSMQDLRKVVIYDRNKNMTNVIARLDSSMKYFITVGAGHLSGQYGIISLLRKKGWKVKPMKMLSRD